MPLFLSVFLYVLTTLAVFGHARAVPVGRAAIARRNFEVDVFSLPSGGITLTVSTPITTQVVDSDPPSTTAFNNPIPTSNDTDPNSDNPNAATPLASSPSPSATNANTTSSGDNANDSGISPDQSTKVSISVVAIIVILSIIAIITAFIGLIFYIRTRRNPVRRGGTGAAAIGGIYAPQSAPPTQETIRTPLNQSFGNSMYGYGAANVGAAAVDYNSDSAYTPAGRAPIQYGNVDPFVGAPIQSGPYAGDRELGQGANVYYPSRPLKPLRPQNPFADVTPSTETLEGTSTIKAGRKSAPTPPPLGDLPMPPPLTPSGSRPASPGGSLWVSRKLPPGGLGSPKVVSPNPSFKI